MAIPDFALYAAEQMLEKPTADFRAVFPVNAVLQTDKKGVLGKEYYTKILAHYENVLEQFDEANKNKFTIYDRLSACAKRLRNSSLEADILERKKKFLWEQYNKTGDQIFLNNLLEISENNDEKQKIIKEMEKTGEKIKESMQVICTPIPESSQQLIKEWFQDFLTKIESLEHITYALFYVAEFWAPVTPESIEKFKQFEKNSCVNRIARRITYGPNGLPINPGTECFNFYIQLQAKQIIQVCRYLNQYFNPQFEDIIPLLVGNKFVPQDHLINISKAIGKFLELDFHTASHFLVIHSETLIKHIADESGILTKKHHENLTFEDKVDIESILDDERFKQAVGENEAFQLELLLYSKEGCKLRHLTAHGILNDDYSSGHFGLFVLWQTWLRILCQGVR